MITAAVVNVEEWASQDVRSHSAS